MRTFTVSLLLGLAMMLAVGSVAVIQAKTNIDDYCVVGNDDGEDEVCAANYHWVNQHYQHYAYGLGEFGWAQINFNCNGDTIAMVAVENGWASVILYYEENYEPVGEALAWAGFGEDGVNEQASGCYGMYAGSGPY